MKGLTLVCVWGGCTCSAFVSGVRRLLQLALAVDSNAALRGAPHLWCIACQPASNLVIQLTATSWHEGCVPHPPSPGVLLLLTRIHTQHSPFRHVCRNPDVPYVASCIPCFTMSV